jgi:hypothetical protein
MGKRPPQSVPTSPLESFEVKFRREGFECSDDSPREIQLAAALPGLFALAVNSGIKLNPTNRITDRECAVLWLACVATDAACQLLDAPFEIALLAMPAWLVAQPNLQNGASPLLEVHAVHERLLSNKSSHAFARRTGEVFLDWVLREETTGIASFRHQLLDLADLIGRSRK